MIADINSTDPIQLLEYVKSGGWHYFKVPVALRTKEMALLAWKVVSFVFARMSTDILPTEYVPEAEWKQFIELLCDGQFVVYLLASENRQSWCEVVQVIDAHIAASSVHMQPASLPVF